MASQTQGNQTPEFDADDYAELLSVGAGTDVEDLLADGADVDDLIMGGVLDVPDEDEDWGYLHSADMPDPTEEEVNELVIALGKKFGIDMSRLDEEVGDAPRKPD